MCARAAALHLGFKDLAVGMIFITQKCKNPKKKPGWKECEAQEKEWLANIKRMSVFTTKYNPAKLPKKAGKSPIVDGNLVGHDRPRVGQSLSTFGGFAGKKVHRPEIVYKDDPELLKRELKARERKFNVAPAYNKGPDTLVTEEELVRTLSSNKRRS